MTEPSERGPKPAERDRDTAPKKAAAKPKTHHGAPATKAEHAAMKRADKTVIKRMRKR